jgi:hypothetical protein
MGISGSKVRVLFDSGVPTKEFLDSSELTLIQGSQAGDSGDAIYPSDGTFGGTSN